MTSLPPNSPRAAARLERDLPALRALVVHSARRRRRRQVAVSAAAVAAAVLALVATAYTLTSTPAPQGALPVSPRLAALEAPAPASPAPEIRIQTIDRAAPSSVVQLDDSGLRAALASAGRPDGLVRIAGRAHLASEFYAMYRPSDPTPP